MIVAEDSLGKLTDFAVASGDLMPYSLPYFACQNFLALRSIESDIRYNTIYERSLVLLADLICENEALVCVHARRRRQLFGRLGCCF